jgi:hypothetical protein
MDEDNLGSTINIPDASASKELWLDCMKAASSRGNLEKQPTVKGVSPKGREIAKRQNYFLTRITFGMPEGYDKIRWRHNEI